MRITTGIDIIETERIEDSINEYGDRFINRLFTEDEIKYCEESSANKVERYSVRFAAKEATYKALDIDGSDDINWRDIEVTNMSTGRPKILLHGALQKKEEDMINIDITLSHLNEIAIANVVVLWK